MLRNASEVEVRIKENDPLIRFEDSAVVFTEASTQTISVLRGIGRNGKRVDPIDREASVKYRTIGKTAISDTDFVNAFGEIVFETGITKKEIKIKIKSQYLSLLNILLLNFTILLLVLFSSSIS